MVDKIDYKHLSGTKPPTVDNLFWVQINQTRLGPSDNQACASHREAARSQPVAIQHSPDNLPIAKRDSRRPIPGLSTVGVITQE